MKVDLKGIFVLVLLLIIEAVTIATLWLPSLTSAIIPLTGQSAAITYLTLWLIWPVIGGIIMVAIIPRILGPLFLRIKGGIWRDYENAYVDLSPELTQGRMFKRAIYIGLLTMGILSLLIYIIPPALLIPLSMEDTIFNMAFVSCIAGFMVPFSIAMWSASWSYHDASLVHYKIPDEDKDELYEVEPIHLRYDSFLKGYAGLSSIIFIVNLMAMQISGGEGQLMAIVVLYVFMHMSLLTLPAIYVHSRMNHTWLRKNLPRARRFTKSDVRILED
jgi:hypothetical protein